MVLVAVGPEVAGGVVMRQGCAGALVAAGLVVEPQDLEVDLVLEVAGEADDAASKSLNVTTESCGHIPSLVSGRGCWCVGTVSRRD